MSRQQRIRGGAIRPSAQAFLDDAQHQLCLARQAQRADDAVVLSYRAALRAAGALIELLMCGRKRRPSGSAWNKVRVLDPSMAQWCQRMEVHARLENRASMGLERHMSPDVAEKLYAQACDLVDYVQAEMQGASKAAS